MSETTKLNIVNMPLLLNFFNTSLLDKMFEDKKMQNDVQITLPEFNIYKHHLADILVKDDKEPLNLKSIANKVKQNQQIYSNLLHPILNDDFELPENGFSSTKGILALIAIITFSIDFIVMLYICYKFRIIRQALTFRAVAAFSNTPRTLIYHAVTTEANQIWYEQISNIIHIEHVNLFFVVIIFLMILVKLLHKWNFKTPHYSINLQVTNGKSC